MIRMSLKICLVIATLFGSVSVGYATNLSPCPSSGYFHNCFGTKIEAKIFGGIKKKYVGEWKDNKRHGKGTVTYGSGAKFSGQFKSDEYVNGTYTWANGNIHVGAWEDGKRNGQGIYTLTNGLVQEGIWKDNVFQFAKSTHSKKLIKLPLIQGAFNTLTKEQRTQLQTNLKDLGLYTSSIDGLYGKGTAGALTEYNEVYLGNADLTKTANVTKLLVTVLIGKKTAYLSSIILRVQKGPDLLDNPLRFWPAAKDIAIIQRNLKLVDFRKLSINGVMTKETIAALRRYNYFNLSNADLNKGKNVDKLLNEVLAISDQKVCSPETKTTIEFCKVCSPETPEKCTTSFLCINATTKSGSSIMWSLVPGRKSYVKEAQNRGLFCEVKKQAAKPTVIPTPKPKVVEVPKPITESEAVKFKRIKKELGLSYYGGFIHSERLPNTLFFFTDIKKNDSFEFRKALRNHDIELIVLSSPGGSVFEGLQTAGIIHDKELKTYIPKNSLFGTGNCASACSFMFFAGEGRSAEGDLGVHQFYSKKASDEEKIGAVQEDAQFTVSEIIGFLNEFETPAWVYERMFQQADMYYFKERELLQLETEVSEKTKAQHDKAESFISDFRAAFGKIKD